ncbi:ABC transporter ATP-binding protein, partial [Helcococcus ovis]|uniref:ABC transporter ATP-binding protein n=1 Tax=Helcococcus ovis TaxID=72026 RepID=UPI0038BA545A
FLVKVVFVKFVSLFRKEYSKVMMIYNNLLRKALNNMDYKDCENPEMISKLRNIRQIQNFTGKGILSPIYNIDEIVSSITLIIGGMALTISFFNSYIPETSKYAILNSTWVNLVFIAVLIITSVLVTKFEVMYDSVWKVIMNAGTLGNNLFSFYGFIINDSKRAVDVRMYNQDKISLNLMKLNTTFSTGGVLDKALKSDGKNFKILKSFVAKIQLLIIYVFVIIKAFEGAITIGMLTQYIGSITQITIGITLLVSSLGYILNNYEYIKEALDYLEYDKTMYNGSLTTEKRADRKYEVEFRNVSFKYPGCDNFVLKNINLKFKLGKRLAIVGQNGSGKSTFIKLLIRLYDPNEGQVLLNGIDIRKYNYKDYLKIFSVVFQDFDLFAFPIAQNISGSINYDKEKVIKALEDVGMMDRVSNMKNGIDTYLYKDIDKEGVDVSGGEAQKIAIARALYQDAAFIILDEPTAALDPLAEQEIYEKLGSIVQDRTAIFISHRLSSCKFSDNILVFDKGSIVEEGNHNELVIKSGKYKDLWDAQAGYYV